MKRKIGLYGGTFDPIHFGHVNLAIEMIEKGKVDAVYLCPAQTSPFKKEGAAVSGEHRLKMIERAIAGIPGISLIQNELNRPAPSYTIDTLKELIASAQEPTQFSLILGEDALDNLERWHKIHEIVRLVPLLIGSRAGAIYTGHTDPLLSEAIELGWVPTRILEISATEIRDRLSKGLYCGHLLHKEVLDYIKEYRLY